MRRGLSNTFFVLLVLAVILAGLAGCTRSVEERVTEDEGTSGAAPTATEAGGAVVAPGQTVVSAVTQETDEQEGETPAGATDVASSAGTDQPTAEATATPSTETSVTPVPEATQAPSSGSSDETVIHVVQSGETLTTIARKYGTTVQAITQANNIANPSLITPGQNLVIPVSGSSGSSSGGTTTGGCRIKHIVKPGEWIWQIARNYGVDPQDILDSNGMRLPSASIIQPGQELCIP